MQAVVSSLDGFNQRMDADTSQSFKLLFISFLIPFLMQIFPTTQEEASL